MSHHRSIASHIASLEGKSIRLTRLLHGEKKEHWKIIHHSIPKKNAGQWRWVWRRTHQSIGNQLIGENVKLSCVILTVSTQYYRDYWLNNADRLLVRSELRWFTLDTLILLKQSFCFLGVSIRWSCARKFGQFTVSKVGWIFIFWKRRSCKYLWKCFQS